MRNLFLLLFLAGASLSIGFSPNIAGDAAHQADLNDDRRIDAEDLLILLNAWQSIPNDRFLDSLYYYRVDGATVSLTASEIAIGIAFQQTATSVDREEFLIDYPILSHFLDEEATHTQIFRIALSEALPIYNMIELLDILAKDSRVDFVTPVFQVPTGEALMDITFLTRFLAEITDEEIEDLNKSFGVDIIESGRLIQNGGIFRLAPSRNEQFPHDPRNAITALYLANLYHEHPETEFSSPHFHTAPVSRITEIGMLLEDGETTNGNSSTIDGDATHRADLNDDRRVDAKDLLILLSQWRASRTDAEEPIHLFYYYRNNKIDLTASETTIGVAFRASVSASDRMQFLEDHSSLSSFVDAATENQKVYRINLQDSMSINRLLRFLDSLAEDSRVEFVAPMCPLQFSEIVLDRAFIVKFAPSVTEEQITTLNNAHGVQILRRGRLGQNGTDHLLAPSEIGLYEYHWRNAVTSLFLANLYHENELTEYSSPNYHISNIFDSE